MKSVLIALPVSHVNERSCVCRTGFTMFADRLNALCSQSDRPVTNLSLAQTLTSHGCRISTAYLSQLRTGVRTRPAPHIIRALASHFEVSVEYFYAPVIYDKEKAVNIDPIIVGDLLDSSMRRLLMCSQSLSESSMDVLTDVARHMRAAEKLPSRCADSPLH